MKILVAVIAYNEQLNIENTLRDLQEHNFGYDIVVIDNGSTDSTARICQQLGITTVSHCINTGSSYGTVSTYFLYAFMHDYDIICQFDGDGQHLAKELPKLIEPIKNNEADFVIGSRFINREGFQSTFLRRIGITLFAAIDSFIVGHKITDATSGFRAYNKKVIDFFAKHYRHEVYDTNQTLLLSHYSGARIKEVPVLMQERKHGASEYNFYNSMVFPIKGVVNVIGCVLQSKGIRRKTGAYGT